MTVVDELVGQTRDWIVGHREQDLPRARLTPILAAKWFVDEWALQLETANSRVRAPSVTFRRRLRDELGDGVEMFNSMGWVDDTALVSRRSPTTESPAPDEEVGCRARLRAPGRPQRVRAASRRTGTRTVAPIREEPRCTCVGAPPSRRASAVADLHQRIPHRHAVRRLQRVRCATPAPSLRAQPGLSRLAAARPTLRGRVGRPGAVRRRDEHGAHRSTGDLGHPAAEVVDHRHPGRTGRRVHRESRSAGTSRRCSHASNPTSRARSRGCQRPTSSAACGATSRRCCRPSTSSGD